MVDNKFYLVSQSVAQRSGVIESRYRIADGRFVLETKDLAGIRLTSEEYVTGLDGVEMVSKQDAMILIKDNNYQMGLPKPVEPLNEEATVESPQEETQEVEEPANGETEETPTDEEAPSDGEQENDENDNNEQKEEEE